MNTSPLKIPLTGLTKEELELLLREHGLDAGYAGRLLYWIYRRKVNSFEEITDIPRKITAILAGFSEPGIIPPFSSVESEDGSVKYLFRNSEGKYYESVYIPDGRRKTLCISVQSGCRMGCTFCATGRYGWHGNLTSGEITGQVTGIPFDVTHVVFMGMGEPCDNADEVIKACTILTSEWGLAKGRANITISTVGMLPGLERLLNSTECNITLSLHSPFAEERAAIVPAEKRWPARTLVDLIKSHNPRRGRRFSVAYVMIDGVNDSDAHLAELRRMLSGTMIRVNLLPYHPLPGDVYRSSDAEKMHWFKHLLVTSGISASIRRSRGNDVYAACGMLAATLSANTSDEDKTNIIP